MFFNINFNRLKLFEDKTYVLALIWRLFGIEGSVSGLRSTRHRKFLSVSQNFEEFILVTNLPLNETAILALNQLTDKNILVIIPTPLYSFLNFINYISWVPHLGTLFRRTKVGVMAYDGESQIMMAIYMKWWFSVRVPLSSETVLEPIRCELVYIIVTSVVSYFGCPAFLDAQPYIICSALKFYGAHKFILMNFLAIFGIKLTVNFDV